MILYNNKHFNTYQDSATSLLWKGICTVCVNVHPPPDPHPPRAPKKVCERQKSIFLCQWEGCCHLQVSVSNCISVMKGGGREIQLEEQRDQYMGVKAQKGFPCGSAGKDSACHVGDLGLIPGLGRSLGEGNGYPLQYSGLENSMDCIVHGGHKESDMIEQLTHPRVKMEQRESSSLPETQLFPTSPPSFRIRRAPKNL